MIANLPTDLEIVAKVTDIIKEAVDTEAELKPNAPLMNELGFDSLDMIETGFALQEFFEFEFSDKEALDELDKALGVGSVIHEGKLTTAGREVLLKRMPELAQLSLPEDLSPAAVQQYYTIESFARLIREFYLAAPTVCPQTGEPVQVKDFRVVAGEDSHLVPMPTGDQLIDAWVAEMAAAQT